MTIQAVLRPRAWMVGVAAVVLVAVNLAMAGPAAADPNVVPSPKAPAQVTVGDRGVAASLTLKNLSTPPNQNDTWTIISIGLTTSCAATSVVTCTSPDPGVLVPLATASARPGTACAGDSFTIGSPDANNVRVLTPSGQVVLGPPGGGSDVCVIDFTFDVIKMPTIDASANIAGIQTLMVGYLTSQSQGFTTNSSASATVTVAPAVRTPPSSFDGTGRSDIAVYRPSTSVWYVSGALGGSIIKNWGSPGDLPAPGDYDGDHITDFAIFRPSTGNWYISRSNGGTAVLNWGANGDIPMPADYDGDGKTDIAVYRPSTGVWYISLSGGGTRIVNWGSPGDVPITGDFDGDGKTDLAVFRPSTGIWYISLSAGGIRVLSWGASGDSPKAGDFDGDGRADVAIYRPSTGVWYISLSGGGTRIVNWGSPGDQAVVGDYDGDGKTDLAVFRPSTGIWYISRSGGGTSVLSWGASGDTPIGAPPE